MYHNDTPSHLTTITCTHPSNTKSWSVRASPPWPSFNINPPPHPLHPIMPEACLARIEPVNCCPSVLNGCLLGLCEGWNMRHGHYLTAKHQSKQKPIYSNWLFMEAEKLICCKLFKLPEHRGSQDSVMMCLHPEVEFLKVNCAKISRE